MQPWALVSPASRGIGLEFARRLLQTTNVPIVATARKDLDQTKENVLTGLNDVKEDRLNVLKVDFLDEQSVIDAQQKASELFSQREHYLHLSLCVPGILYPEKAPSQIEYNHAVESFQVNTLGPMMLLKHFGSFLPKKGANISEIAGLPTKAIWANMSARVGSISDNNSMGGWYSYRASKAALNQITRTFDNHLKMNNKTNAMSISMHPGTVKTDFSKEFWKSTKEDKLFSPEYAVSGLMEMINSRTQEHRGRCWDYKSEEVPP